LGGADVHDILNLLPVAESLPYADTSRLFITGLSRGGMMALQAIRQGLRARAAVVVGAPADWESAMKDNLAVARIAQDYWPDYRTNPEQAIRSRSPSYWPEEINVPVLIIAGGQDLALTSRQPLRLAAKLDEAGKLFELVIYANDDHPVSRHREERISKTIDWFQNPRKFSIAAALSRTLAQHGIQQALAQYRTTKLSGSDLYDLSEEELNGLGHQLLFAGKKLEAIEIFRLNLEAFPASAHSYDSLAEAYESNGQTELAIKNYERTLELDSKNQHARLALSKLKGS